MSVLYGSGRFSRPLRRSTVQRLSPSLSCSTSGQSLCPSISGVVLSTRATRALKSCALAVLATASATTANTHAKNFFMSGGRCEKQVLVVETEVGDRRDRLHGDALDLAFGAERKRHVRGLDVWVIKSRDERVVLVVLELATHVGGIREIDPQTLRGGLDGLVFDDN